MNGQSSLIVIIIFVSTFRSSCQTNDGQWWQPAKDFHGVNAHPEAVVSLAWQDGKLQSAEIKNINGTRCNVRYGDKTTPLFLKRARLST
jgi:hypothetical protein